jgi:hypothetical protein
MRKGPGSVYDKWNISVVICDIGIFCIPARNAALKNKSNDWLAWHYDNVIEWSDISTHGLLFSEEALSQFY